MTHYAVSRWRVLALPPAAEDVALLINLPRVSPFSQNGHSSGQVQLRDFPRVPWGEGTVCKFEAAGRREAGSTRPGDQQQAGHPLANHILSTGAGGPGVCGEGLLTAEGAPGVSHCPLATRAQRRHGWEGGPKTPLSSEHLPWARPASEVLAHTAEGPRATCSLPVLVFQVVTGGDGHPSVLARRVSQTDSWTQDAVVGGTVQSCV